MTDTQQKVGKFLWEEGLKWLARTLFIGVAFVLAALFTPLWDQVKDIWHSPDRLARIEQQQAEITNTLQDFREEIRRANGEDRVIRQTPGLSYVEEPVRQGENVVMFMVAERTRLGKDCRLTEWTPLFTDRTNITVPGQRANAGPVRRQIEDAPVKLRIEIVPPPTLRPGRVELYLALVYDCAGDTVPERTDIVTYELLARG